jgi:hypothetical protein
LAIRKILERSSEKKNHNGGEKISLKELKHKKMKEFQIKLSEIIASLKDDGYRPTLELYPKTKAGKVYADFAIYDLTDDNSKKLICLIKFTSKSLNVKRTFFQAKNPTEVFTSEDFLKSLSLKGEVRNKFKDKIKTLLK